ncbi:MAG TPA: hypothetical protein VFL91_30485, partial [Thermomicrobiales bacterium]|nr:hypothetical protein [Thermomicrobiales bacterium]
MKQYADDAPIAAAQPTAVPLALPYAEVAAQGQFAADRRARLTYGVPPFLRGRVAVGQLVWAPLRRKLVLGVVTELHDTAPPFAARDIHAPVEPEFRLTPRHLALAAWIAERYCCTLFEAALPMLPPGAARRSVVHLVTTGAPPPLAGLSPRARRLLSLLEERGETSLADAQEALDSSLAGVVPTLERLGLVERVARVVHDAPHIREERYIRLLPAGLAGAVDLARAPRQAAVLDLLRRQARLGRTQDSGLRTQSESEEEKDSDEGTLSPKPLVLSPSAALPLQDVYRLTGANRTIVRGLEETGLVEVFGAPGRAEPAALRPRRYEPPPPL